MNTRPDRRIVAEVVIILAACIGGWMVIVEPPARALREAESEIESARANPILSSRDMIVRMAGRMSEVRDRVKSIDALGALGRDSSRMYGLVMGIAKAHEVTIHRLDPGAPRVDTGASGATRSADAATFDMRVEGTYEAVASFLLAIEEMNGFVRPKTLRLAPRGDERQPIVEADFTFEALSFTVPPALAGLMNSDADA